MNDENPPARPDAQALLDMMAAMPQADWPPDPATYRAQYRAMIGLADLPAGDLAICRDIEIPGPAGPLRARLFDAREARVPGPALVYFHGGGFVIGDIDTHAHLTAQMARALDMPVISVDYRLAPECPWPAAPDDCVAAARWIATSPDALGHSVTALALAGDSAGGLLAAATAIALRDAPAAVPVIAQLLIYPATDMHAACPSLDRFGEGYGLTRRIIDWFNQCCGADPDDLRAAPVRADLTGLPPAVIVTAQLDPIRDQGRAYAAALIGAGVPVIFREAVGNIHGFINLQRAVPSSQGDVAAMLNAFRDMLTEAEADRVMAQAAS